MRDQVLVTSGRKVNLTLFPFCYATTKNGFRDVIAAAQQATEPGASIMAVMSHPYLLDFGRNRIFVVDHAGSSGPGQGLPVSAPALELAVYLRKHDVDYLIYSYTDEANFGRAKYGHRLNWNGSPYADRVRVLAKNTFLFHEQLVVLSKSYRIIYQDNYSVVIDLRLKTRQL